MTYEKTPVKKTEVKASKVLNHFGTPTILWHLLKRHKLGIAITWAIIMTALYLVPPLPEIMVGVLFP